ncbi:ABC transporter permease [Microbispora sp. H11081]|uniref:ABC transporter permease n=1 Tax=Microbispora sp. H11081 TaxID=2729107 RepID=UPI0014743E96|nr:ABC transporter permease [Microbispora sp. H11081]
MTTAQTMERADGTQERSRPLKRPRKRPPVGLLLTAPVIVFLIIFFVYPVAEIFRLSFVDDDGALSLGHYTAFAGTDVYVTILIRTIYTSIIVTGLCALIAFPYAYLMVLVGPKARAVMLGVVLIPLWTSLLARTYAWIILLSDVGPVVAFLSVFGLEVTLLGTTRGVLIGMVQVLLPFITLPLYNTMRTIDRRLVMAAQSLGATAGAAFRQVFLPLTAPGLITGSVMVFVLGLGFHVTPALLGSPSQSMLGQLAAQEISLKLAWGSAGAMSVILSVLTLIVLLIAARFGMTKMLTSVGGKNAR